MPQAICLSVEREVEIREMRTPDEYGVEFGIRRHLPHRGTLDEERFGSVRKRLPFLVRACQLPNVPAETWCRQGAVVEVGVRVMRVVMWWARELIWWSRSVGGRLRSRCRTWMRTPAFGR